MSDKSKRCVLFMTFRPSQRTLFMARRNWVPLALSAMSISMDQSILSLQSFKVKKCTIYVFEEKRLLSFYRIEVQTVTSLSNRLKKHKHQTFEI